MTCDETQRMLLEQTTDETPLPTEVRNHLQECLVCQQVRVELSELNAAWLDASDPSDPSSLSSGPRVQNIMHYLDLHEMNFRAPQMSHRTQTETRVPNVSPVSQRHRKAAWKQTLYHYGIAASLALVLANVGFFTSLSADLSMVDAQVSGYVQGAVQYVVHPQF